MPINDKQKYEEILMNTGGELFPEATVTLSVEQQVVRASTTGDAFTITLPDVAESAGRIYTIYMVARSDTDDITIEDNGDDSSLTDITLDAAAEYSILYSDGYEWFELASNHA